MEILENQETTLKQQQNLLANITQRLEALEATQHVLQDSFTTATEAIRRNSSTLGDA